MDEKVFNFVQFKDVGSRLGTYYISINKHGAFGLNSGFYNAENIRNFTHVQLFYDKKEKVIGLAFTNTPAERDSFKITHGKNSGSVVVRSFFMSILLGREKDLIKYVGRYVPQAYSDVTIGKLFYITLKEENK